MGNVSIRFYTLEEYIRRAESEAESIRGVEAQTIRRAEAESIHRAGPKANRQREQTVGEQTVGERTVGEQTVGEQSGYNSCT